MKQCGSTHSLVVPTSWASYTEQVLYLSQAQSSSNTIPFSSKSKHFPWDPTELARFIAGHSHNVDVYSLVWSLQTLNHIPKTRGLRQPTLNDRLAIVSWRSREHSRILWPGIFISSLLVYIWIDNVEVCLPDGSPIPESNEADRNTSPYSQVGKPTCNVCNALYDSFIFKMVGTV